MADHLGSTEDRINFVVAHVGADQEDRGTTVDLPEDSMGGNHQEGDMVEATADRQGQATVDHLEGAVVEHPG
jgi:hypothetical protein